jgi:hypothetical protein
MIARCHLTRADYRAFQLHALFRYRKVHWLYGVILIFILLQSWFSEKTLFERISLMIGATVMFAVAITILTAITLILSHFLGTRFRGTTGEHIFEVSTDGISESHANGKVETKISGIKRIDETARHFFVLTSCGLGYIIPKRDLDSFDSLHALQASIEKIRLTRRCS